MPGISQRMHWNKRAEKLPSGCTETSMLSVGGDLALQPARAACDPAAAARGTCLLGA